MSGSKRGRQSPSDRRGSRPAFVNEPSPAAVEGPEFEVAAEFSPGELVNYEHAVRVVVWRGGLVEVRHHVEGRWRTRGVSRLITEHAMHRTIAHLVQER